MLPDPEFEDLVSRYYRPLYQFALSLTRAEADASDLTQQTFYIWANKGSQLKDRGKAKTWLFTTLHREYLSARRRIVRFPQVELMTAEAELPTGSPPDWSHLDADKLLEALSRLEEAYRAPLALFYLEDQPYKDIAETLDLPIGTVKSRLSRGMAKLQLLLAQDSPAAGAEGRASHD